MDGQLYPRKSINKSIEKEMGEENSIFLEERVVINFSSVWCKIISNNSVELHSYLYEKLAYMVDGYYFSPRYQSGLWDGFNRLYKINTYRFRSGLLDKVIKLLKEARCDIEVKNFPSSNINKVTKVIYKDGNNIDVELRSYQIKAIEMAFQRRFGIIQAPPRSGKTLIATAIIKEEQQFPAVFFVRSKDLAYQVKKIFENNFQGVGFICDGVCEIKDINIITIQSAYSAYNKKYIDKGIPEEKEVINKIEVQNFIKNVKIMFYDESHHISGDTSRFISDKVVNANMKIGLSATPFSDKSEANLVEETIGSVIFQISYSELIKEGFLMKPYIYMYKLPKKEFKGTYNSIYKQAIIEDEFFNSLLEGLVKKLVGMGKSVVVQTEFIEHSKNLARRFNCEYLTGKDTTEKRRKLIKALNDREILCLVSTLFEEGLDVPSLSYTINVAGGLSNISTFQRMRSITAHESKTSVGIIDFIHQCKYLKRHSKKRFDLYQSEPEFIVEVRDVSKCKIKEIFND